MAKRAMYAAPVAIVVFGLAFGVAGAISTAFAIALVLANFAMSAGLNAYAARISPPMLMASALFGFLIRLGLIFVVFFLVKDAEWMKVVPFGVTVLVAHLGLLFWEMRYISASLAFPGLKPTSSPAPGKES
jgi:hypothetical protein